MAGCHRHFLSDFCGARLESNPTSPGPIDHGLPGVRRPHAADSGTVLRETLSRAEPAGFGFGPDHLGNHDPA